MRYEIVESHYNWTFARIERMKNFFMEVKNLDEEAAYSQVDFINWYKKDKTAICFEAVAYDGSCVVGYMRCFNNPDVKEEWFVGDIHVLKSYRRKGIAGRLYKKVIDEVMNYEDAQCINASIDLNNKASIGLHEKFGFVNSQKKGSFADFYFDENERFFGLRLLKTYPLLSDEFAVEFLKPIWEEYLSQNESKNIPNRYRISFENLLSDSLRTGKFSLYAVWCGNVPVGIKIESEDDYLEYIRD